MKKKIRVTFNSPVILWFVIICFVALILGLISGGKITQLLFMTYHSTLRSPLTYIRFFTHVLGHDGWGHFIGNMAYILLLGPMLEEKYGGKTLLLVMGITALSTALINYIFFWNCALCGASGIVFAFIMLSALSGFKDGEIPLTFILVAVIFLGQQIYEGVFVPDNVSNLSHIIGGIVGTLAGYLLNKKTR